MTEGQSITIMAITRATPMRSVVIAWGENRPLLNRRLSFWCQPPFTTPYAGQPLRWASQLVIEPNRLPP